MERNVGNNDLRIDIEPHRGFFHVILRDADDGDVIVVNEDDVELLRDELNLVLAAMKGASHAEGKSETD